MLQNKSLDKITQVLLPVLTLSGQSIIATGHPKLGFFINMLAQPFWLYSSWKAYKKAGQIGMFLTTIAMTIISIIGLINFW